MRARLSALVGLLLLALAACGGSPAEQTPTAPPAVTTTAALPTSVEVPSIGASSSLIATGLNPDNTIEVPPVEQPQQASWFEYSPRPGDTGPAVVLGHVNGGGVDGVFAHLDDIAVGDEVLVDRADGTTARFSVYDVRRYCKHPDDRQCHDPPFDTAAVYGDTSGPELRLITCGGEFDKTRRSYRDNVVAFARLTT